MSDEPQPDRSQIMAALDAVTDPKSGQGLTSAGLVRGLSIRGSRAAFMLEVPAADVAAYAGVRDRLCPKPTAHSFLVSAAGTRLAYVAVQQVFSGLIRAAGIKPEPGGRGPRLHDTRH